MLAALGAGAAGVEAMSTARRVELREQVRSVSNIPTSRLGSRARVLDCDYLLQLLLSVTGPIFPRFRC
jgi:hypothetical protein